MSVQYLAVALQKYTCPVVTEVLPLNLREKAWNSGFPNRCSMDMSKMTIDTPDSASSPPDMVLHVSVKEPGTYKLWLQFRGGNQLYIAPFVLVAN